MDLYTKIDAGATAETLSEVVKTPEVSVEEPF
jgi:hypothetical protein